MQWLSISEVVTHTGVSDGTLRMWERRFGFPTPQRLPSGHRRYTERDLELIGRVASARAAGVSLAVAIARATRQTAASPPSLFAALRRLRPDLEPRPLPKRLMLALSRAIEEESLSRAADPLLFASFQREAFYRVEEPRWRELSRAAALSVAFADFARCAMPPGGPAEIPVDPADPLAREWALVCDSERHAVCLAGWEPLSSTTATAGERTFESIWSVDPDVVRDAARICAEMAATHVPALIAALRDRLDAAPSIAVRDQLRLATAITNRTLSALA